MARRLTSLRSIAANHQRKLVDRQIVRRGGQELARKKPVEVRKLT